MRMMHVKIKGKINACRSLVKSTKERDYLEDLNWDVSIVLKSIIGQ